MGASRPKANLIPPYPINNPPGNFNGGQPPYPVNHRPGNITSIGKVSLLDYTASDGQKYFIPAFQMGRNFSQMQTNDASNNQSVLTFAPFTIQPQETHVIT